MELNGLVRLVVGNNPHGLQASWRAATDPAWVTLLVLPDASEVRAQVDGLNAAAKRTAVYVIELDLADVDAVWTLASEIVRGLAQGVDAWTEPAIDRLWITCPADEREQLGLAVLLDALRPYWASSFTATYIADDQRFDVTPPNEPTVG